MEHTANSPNQIADAFHIANRHRSVNGRLDHTVFEFGITFVEIVEFFLGEAFRFCAERRVDIGKEIIDLMEVFVQLLRVGFVFFAKVFVFGDEHFEIIDTFSILIVNEKTFCEILGGISRHRRFVQFVDEIDNHVAGLGNAVNRLLLTTQKQTQA